MAPPKLIDYLVIFLNLEKYIIYLKSLPNPHQLYNLKRHQNVRGLIYMGQGWHGHLRTPSGFKSVPELAAFNSHSRQNSRQKDAFDSELRLIKLNKNRHSRPKWC